MDRAFLQAQMPVRAGGADDAAKRFGEWLALVKAVDPTLAEWRLVGRKHPLPIDEGSLRRVLGGSALRNDEGVLMPDSGVGLTLASVEHPSTALHFRVGLPDGPILNNFFAQFPKSRELPLAVAERILEATVAAWQPSWATIATDTWADAFPSRPFVGWITYVRSAVPGTSRAPSRPLDGGIVVTLSERAPDPADVALLETAEAVRRDLHDVQLCARP
ncbi:MAG: immunity 52 family protein [Deltaproteobacteria bacterium]|nr:immunity 52 family protein [Deltaproteobacteria bacterium]